MQTAPVHLRLAAALGALAVTVFTLGGIAATADDVVAMERARSRAAAHGQAAAPAAARVRAAAQCPALPG